MDVKTVIATQVAIPSTISQSGGGQARTTSDIPEGLIPSNSTSSIPASISSATPAGDIASTIKQLNDSFAQHGVGLYSVFDKDKDTGISVVQFIDKETNEVIRQFPTRELIAIARSFDLAENMRGQLIQDKS